MWRGRSTGCGRQWGVPATLMWGACAARRCLCNAHSKVPVLARYYVAEDWTPKKLEVLVDVPDTLDLERLRGRGPQPSEALQPEAPQAASVSPGGGAGAPAHPAPAPVEPDPDTVAALVGMGFSENGSKRAALATQARGNLCTRLVSASCERPGTRG